MSSFWGGGGTKSTVPAGATVVQKNDDLSAQFEKAMTPAERAKLYEAIDYQENQTTTTYPKEVKCCIIEVTSLYKYVY